MTKSVSKQWQPHSDSMPGKLGVLVGPRELEAPGCSGACGQKRQGLWQGLRHLPARVEPIGIVLKHNKKGTPEFSWLLQSTRESALANSRDDTSRPEAGWNSPREQQKTFLGDRHTG